MYPNDARLRNLSYSSVITCNIYQKIVRINDKTGKIDRAVKITDTVKIDEEE